MGGAFGCCSWWRYVSLLILGSMSVSLCIVSSVCCIIGFLVLFCIVLGPVVGCCCSFVCLSFVCFVAVVVRWVCVVWLPVVLVGGVCVMLFGGTVGSLWGCALFLPLLLWPFCLCVFGL